MAVIGVQSLNTRSNCFGEGRRYVQSHGLLFIYLFFNFNDFIKLMLTSILITDVVYRHISAMSFRK